MHCITPATYNIIACCLLTVPLSCWHALALCLLLLQGLHRQLAEVRDRARLTEPVGARVVEERNKLIVCASRKPVRLSRGEDGDAWVYEVSRVFIYPFIPIIPCIYHTYISYRMLVLHECCSMSDWQRQWCCMLHLSVSTQQRNTSEALLRCVQPASHYSAE
jgi:hypothetical protein